MILINLDSKSFYPLEINRKFFELGIPFFHIFSFDFECISVGRFVHINSGKYPVFRRTTGGGIVFHAPQKDISFAFSFYLNSIKIKEVFNMISAKLCAFLSLKFDSKIFTENGSIYFSDGRKICGIAMARRKNFFLVEGCISVQREKMNKHKKNVCFVDFGEKIENFYALSSEFLDFLIKNFKNI